MSQHWKPDGDRALWTTVESYAPATGKSWPKGATAGVLLVAVGCLAIGGLLYQVAGPRVAIERNSSVDWNSVELPIQKP